MDTIETPRPRTSVAAILSLIFGLLGCIPFLTGLVALVLGIVGIKRTGDPMVTGRGMAIAGVVLGALSLVGWTVATATVGGGIIFAFRMAEGPRLVAEQFTRDLSQGKVDAALAVSAEGIDRAALEALAKRMEPWGPFQGLALNSVNMRDSNGRAEFTIGGPATFANEARSYSMTLHKVVDGYKVSKVDFP